MYLKWKSQMDPMIKNNEFMDVVKILAIRELFMGLASNFVKYYEFKSEYTKVKLENLIKIS